MSEEENLIYRAKFIITIDVNEEEEHKIGYASAIDDKQEILEFLKRNSYRIIYFGCNTVNDEGNPLR